ncbi:CE1759 family FMN reductase [Naasia sp. SYSU D00948]|uniref:CE1759 family FMN reductase n=1 Tax=Naasia sp. SYSU D00948 TaxID=2817379 RepID=UPI001B312B39|nr:CE1759 family FMN reductase [Naasia sp. SYSU D00948]
MTTRTLAVVSAGLSRPSSTRMLADRLADATAARLRETGDEVEVVTIELRDLASDITNNLLTGFPAPRLAEALETVASADGLVAVTPIFSASYSGLFKSFFDVLEPGAISDLPVLLGATGGTARHSLALDFALRPLFSYLHAAVAPTAVFAATDDWGDADDAAKPLPERIDRAAAEFAEVVRRSTRTAGLRDPFALPAGFDPTGVGGIQ